MYIIFIDESGNPGGFDIETNSLKKNTSKYFVLSGFMINADEILDIEAALKMVKIKNRLNPYHELKWNTKYASLGLTYDKMLEVKRTILGIISNRPNSLVGIVIDKEQCYKNKSFVNNHNDLYALALHLLMERCCMQMTDENGMETTIPAMIFADSRKNDANNKLDKELQVAYLRAKNMGTHFVKFPNFCDSLLFVDSDYSSGIQLADFCAGAIFKKYESGDTTFFDIVKPALRTHHGNVYGAGLKEYK